MSVRFARLPGPPAALVAVVLGIAAANLVRLDRLALAGLALASSALAVVVLPGQRLALVAVGAVLLGWWWGSHRLNAIDRSPLTPLLGTSERSIVVVTGPPRRSRYAVRVPAELHRFGSLDVTEPILLELAAGRSPNQGDVLDVLGVLTPPHGPERGFDERTWLRRHGVHVVLRGDRWREIGRRGGLGGVADRLRAFVTRGLSRGSGGEHRAVLLGVVLGADEGLSQSLRDRFRASGLYHLLSEFTLSSRWAVVPSRSRRPTSLERVGPTGKAPTLAPGTWSPRGMLEPVGRWPIERPA